MWLCSKTSCPLESQPWHFLAMTSGHYAVCLCLGFFICEGLIIKALALRGLAYYYMKSTYSNSWSKAALSKC